MKKPQWIIAGVGIFLVLFLFIATQQQLFGTRKQTAIAAAAAPAASTFRIDQHIAHVKEHLKPEQVTRLSLLENSITRGDVSEQKLHVYHQLARFWQDTGRLAEPDEWFEPYAWYSGEAARLENSEKSLTFAAHLFLNNLRFEDDPAIKQWKALQAKDLFERSLKLNSANDSAQVGLGAVYLYGGITNNPMEGLSRIRSVVDKDSGNVYAQMTLGRASMETGQLDRAIQRFLTVVRLDPMNLEATVSLADAHEQKGDKPAAIEWYRRCLPLIKNAGLQQEVQQRISELSK